jgi:cell wall-associated NlpC family hydrolase
MKRIALALALAACLSVPAFAQDGGDFWSEVRTVIQRHLGRPYVWGATGLKSFDCSGFLWRVMYENGILTKRTTARKLYMMLPPVSEAEKWEFGTIVFFDNLKHVGIVDGRDAFYHAQVTLGTNRSPMNSFWQHKIYGFRRFPAFDKK